jgi:hypothetical protein
MRQYTLTIRVPFEALDDPLGRKVAQEKLREMNLPDGVELKLQEVQKNAAPRKIDLRR